MTFVALIRTYGIDPRSRERRILDSGLAVITLGTGIAALVAETYWVLLVPMVAGLVVMWALALLRDASDDPIQPFEQLPQLRRLAEGKQLAGALPLHR